MTAFLVGMAAGLAVGFVVGAVWTVILGQRYERRARQRFAELDQARAAEDGQDDGG